MLVLVRSNFVPSLVKNYLGHGTLWEWAFFHADPLPGPPNNLFDLKLGTCLHIFKANMWPRFQLDSSSGSKVISPLVDF